MTNPELVAHILKQGGRLLLVGGETKDLPRSFHENAQILIWDDDKINILNREIPSNVRVIMWSRWISHTMVARLNNAAKQLHAIKFPMLKPREIRLLLSEIVHAEPAQDEVIPMEVLDQEIEKVEQTNPPEPFPSYEMEGEVKETTVAKTKMGGLQAFYAKYLNVDRDYTVKGSKVDEARRLMKIAEREGVKTTLGSLANGLLPFLKKLQKGRTSTPKPKATTEVVKQPSMNDDFEELERLISDAIVAMKLVQEHLPKVRKETEKLRGLKQKFLRLLE